MLLSDPAYLMSQPTDHQVFLIPNMCSGDGIHAMKARVLLQEPGNLVLVPVLKNLLWNLEEVTKFLDLVSSFFKDISSTMISRLFPY